MQLCIYAFLGVILKEVFVFANRSVMFCMLYAYYVCLEKRSHSFRNCKSFKKTVKAGYKRKKI